MDPSHTKPKNLERVRWRADAITGTGYRAGAFYPGALCTINGGRADDI